MLRLLCLQSLVSNGLKAAKFDSLRREVLQTYGYELLLTLNNLERVGLLFARGGRVAVSAVIYFFIFYLPKYVFHVPIFFGVFTIFFLFRLA